MTVLLPVVPDRYRAIVATAGGTGLRWGEAAGLCADALDLDQRRLRVIRTIIEVSGQTSFKPFPKSAAGRRTVPLPPWLVEIIQKHRGTYPPGEDGLVFPNAVRNHSVAHCSAPVFGGWLWYERECWALSLS